MPLPIVVTYTFANATTSIPLSQLDSNFTTVVNAVNGIGNGTNALSNVSITGGSISGLTTPLAAASGGTGITSSGTSGNVLVSNGSGWQSSPVSGLNTGVQGNFKNLKVQVTANTTCNVTCDQITLYDGTLYSTQSTVSVSISTGSTGANGVETGTTLTASTWYYVWIIYNGSTVAGLISASSTAPTMPSGYTYKARVGAVYYTSGSVLARTLQYGRKAQYVVTASSGTTSIPYLFIGATGSTSPLTWTALSVVNFVPATSCAINLFITASYNAGTTSNVNVAPNNSYGLPNSTNPPPMSTGLSANTYITYASWLTLESTNVYATSAASGGGLFVLGWEDNL